MKLGPNDTINIEVLDSKYRLNVFNIIESCKQLNMKL
jgi:hypothetical protein